MRRRGHTYELVLPQGERDDIHLAVGSRINITNDGDPQPFCIIELLAKGRTRITFRADDERITEADLELLQYMALERERALLT